MTYIKFLKIIAILLFFCSFQQILTLSAQQTNSQNLTNNVCSIKNVSYDEQTKILSFSYNFNAVNSGDLFYLQIYYYLPQEKTPSPRYAANKTFPLGSSDSFKNKKFQIPLNGDVSLDFVYSFRTVIYNSATNTYYGEINCKNSISNLSNKNKFLVSPQVNDSKKCDVQNLTYNRQTGNLSYEYKFAPGVSWIIVTVRNNAGREIKQKNYNSSQGIENAKKGNIELKSKPNPNQVRVYTRVYKENQRAWSKPKLCDLTVSKNIRQRTKTARRIQERSNFQTTQTTKQAKRNNKVLSRVRRSRDRTRTSRQTINRIANFFRNLRDSPSCFGRTPGANSESSEPELAEPELAEPELAEPETTTQPFKPTFFKLEKENFIKLNGDDLHPYIIDESSNRKKYLENEFMIDFCDLSSEYEEEKAKIDNIIETLEKWKRYSDEVEKILAQKIRSDLKSDMDRRAKDIELKRYFDHSSDLANRIKSKLTLNNDIILLSIVKYNDKYEAFSIGVIENDILTISATVTNPKNIDREKILGLNNNDLLGGAGSVAKSNLIDMAIERRGDDFEFVKSLAVTEGSAKINQKLGFQKD